MDLLQCQPIIILAPVIEHTAVLNTNTSKADKVSADAKEVTRM